MKDLCLTESRRRAIHESAATGTVPHLTDAARQPARERGPSLHGLDAERIDTPLAWATVALEDILTHLEETA